MKKVLITRYGAFGDHLHATHLPRLLKERAGFDYVAFDYNTKGAAVYANNPFIDEHILFEPEVVIRGHMNPALIDRRLQVLSKGFDRHINLQNSLEYGYIAMEEQIEYYMSSKARREMFGKLNYYDQTSEWAGFPEFKGAKGELYFTEEEYQTVKGIYENSYLGQFVVICNLSGTSRHKTFYGAEPIIRQFLKQHPDAVCITMGDDDAKKHLEFQGDRIINRAGIFEHNGKKLQYSFRQSMLMTKYANLVIGCESGLMVASTLLGTPTIQLMTAASIKNHGGDFENDFSLQSPAACSPCHKGPYEYIGCPKFEYLGQQYPACIKFEMQTVLERMNEVYAASRKTHSKTDLSAV